MKISIRKMLPGNVVKLYEKLRLIKYIGNAVYCPCCGKRFRRLRNFKYDRETESVSHFENTYKNTICPNRFSFPRHRLICSYFDEHRDVLPENHQNILMFAAEDACKRWMEKNKYREFF
ncbi:hypothetical protein AGMMS49928_05990 [Spirochaetia bacterium]|nr:hypothetical protein AGMMS49928_05990 [Spirochaetia bacterium]